MNSSKIREAFEAWANTQGVSCSEGYNLARNTNHLYRFRYRNMRTQHAFEGFSGALEQSEKLAQQAELSSNPLQLLTQE